MKKSTNNKNSLTLSINDFIIYKYLCVYYFSLHISKEWWNFNSIKKHENHIIKKKKKKTRRNIKIIHFLAASFVSRKGHNPWLNREKYKIIKKKTLTNNFIIHQHLCVREFTFFHLCTLRETGYRSLHRPKANRNPIAYNTIRKKKKKKRKKEKEQTEQIRTESKRNPIR